MSRNLATLLKLSLSDDERAAFDRGLVLRAQLTIKGRGEVLKILRGQYCLAEALQEQFEEWASAMQLVNYCSSPQALYKTLLRLGYTWDTNRRVWRLFKNLKRPRQLKESKQ